MRFFLSMKKIHMKKYGGFSTDMELISNQNTGLHVNSFKSTRRVTRKAWCVLQGESPCRGRPNQLPVLSVAPVAESMRARTKQVKRTQRIVQAVGSSQLLKDGTASKCQLRSARVLTYTEANTEASVMVRM